MWVWAVCSCDAGDGWVGSGRGVGGVSSGGGGGGGRGGFLRCEERRREGTS